MTLIFLRQLTLEPTKSAWEFFNAPFDYAATPLGLLGCRIIIHKKPSVRNTWDFRGKYGWSLVCFLEHYRCQRVAPKDTKAVQISDTHEYRHHYLTQPTLTPEDCVLHGLQTLTCALEDAPSQMCKEQLRAISTLQDLFDQWNRKFPTYPRQNKAPRAPPKKPPKKGKTKQTIKIGNRPPTQLPPSPAQAPRVQVMKNPPHSAPRVDVILPPDITDITTDKPIAHCTRAIRKNPATHMFTTS